MLSKHEMPAGRSALQKILEELPPGSAQWNEAQN